MAWEKVDLPSGAWVEFRDPEQTTEKQRRPLKRLQMRVGMDKQLRGAMKELTQAAADADKASTPAEREQAMDSIAVQFELSDSQMDLLESFPDVTTMALVEAWSFDLPLTVDGLLSIPGSADYEAIVMAAAQHRDKLMPDFDEPTPAGVESPTGASVD